MSTLYIMRHGDAISRAATDAERPLSDLGQGDAASMVPCLLERPPQTIWVSPYLRAQQTAAIVVTDLVQAGFKPKVETVSGITPEDNPYKLVDLLSDVTEGPLMLVSHNPFVSTLLSLLTEGHSQARIGMATASIVCLDGEVNGMGTMTLQWYKTPADQAT
ncbi:MAG: phosphohistidine phosphatase SixA [Pseudomonadota bacterium]|nr:phosphohistidine phosphatase SixA [Pseudomonadota bacterium]